MGRRRSNGRKGRTHLRVAVELDAWASWGYERVDCEVTDFSVRGLSVRGLDVPERTPLSIGLALPAGTFTVCGVVVHNAGTEGTSGVRLLELPVDAQVDLEGYLWDLLAAPLKDVALCSVAGCDKAKKARGMCSTHYGRWRRRNRARKTAP